MAGPKTNTKKTSPPTGTKTNSVRFAILVMWFFVVAGSGAMIGSRFVSLPQIYISWMLGAGLASALLGAFGLGATGILLREKPSEPPTDTVHVLNTSERISQMVESVPDDDDGSEPTTPDAAPPKPILMAAPELEPIAPIPSKAAPDSAITVHAQVWGQPKEVAEDSGEAQTQTSDSEPFTFIKPGASDGESGMDGFSPFGKSEIGGVHTLVTLSMREKKGEDESSEENSSPETEVDAILFDRLDEYKLYKPDEGCVLLITQTLLPNEETTALVPRLNGATAALNLARTAATVHGLSTLLIDAGSLAWSRYSASDWTSGPAPDVVDLPRIPGVFDILAGTSDFDDWLMIDDDAPLLSALAPGEIPADWQEALQSDRMKELIMRARKEADVIIIYAPNIHDHPETVKALGALSNGILLVSGTGTAGAADELAAMNILPEGAVVLGRIALGDENQEAEIKPEGGEITDIEAKADESESTESSSAMNGLNGTHSPEVQNSAEAPMPVRIDGRPRRSKPQISGTNGVAAPDVKQKQKRARRRSRAVIPQ